MSVDQAVSWIEKGNQVMVAGPDGPAVVQGVRVAGQPPYVRTVADGIWADNLLQLPRF